MCKLVGVKDHAMTKLLLILIIIVTPASFYFGFDYGKTKVDSEYKTLATQHIEAVVKQLQREQEKANRAASELDTTQKQLNTANKELHKRNQSHAQTTPICHLDADTIRLYNDAITHGRSPMLQAAIPAESTSSAITTYDLIDNHIDNTTRCTTIEAQLTKLITLINDQQKESAP
jgi:hypothetical protein